MYKRQGLYFQTSEQHIDLRESQILRNDGDLIKLSEWFSVHDPFPTTKEIMSIGTGIIGSAAINCYAAKNVGEASIMRMIGKIFKDVKIKRSDRVCSLSTMYSSVKIDDKIVPIDPFLMYQRMLLLKKSDTDLELSLIHI